MKHSQTAHHFVHTRHHVITVQVCVTLVVNPLEIRETVYSGSVGVPDRTVEVAPKEIDRLVVLRKVYLDKSETHSEVTGLVSDSLEHDITLSDFVERC